jgi:hypothetical protein
VGNKVLPAGTISLKLPKYELPNTAPVQLNLAKNSAVMFPVLSKTLQTAILPPFTEIQMASKTELQDAAPLYINIASFFLRFFKGLLPSVSTLSPCRLLPNTDPRLRPVRKW